MAHLRKIKNAYYLYFHDADRTPKDKSYPLGNVKLSTARSMKAELEVQYRLRTFDPWCQRPAPPDVPQTLRDAINAFFAERQDIRATTERNYRQTLLPFLHTTPPGMYLSEVSGKQLRPFIYQRGRKPATHATRHRILKLFFNYAVQQGWMEASPLRLVKAPSLPGTAPHYFTQEQFTRLIEAMESGGTNWLARMSRFAVATGLRRGELCALRWENVEVEGAFPSLILRNDARFRTKSGADHRLPLIPGAVEVLREIGPRGDGVIFLSATGGPVNEDYLTKRFKHYVKEAGLPAHLHLHSLRHTCASWIVQSGASLFVASKVLGHSSMKPTEIYAHLTNETLRETMERALSRPASDT